ncbi:MAG: glutamate racemase [Lewinella sp.]|nr:glutamate racemase [Lewinella sp.]
MGVFDSGIGGLTVANAILDLLPAESILYYADTAHLPYGRKSPDEIRSYSHHITGYLLDRDCKAIVVACNTASAAALDYLRNSFPEVIIVGMEPAVKPAAQATRSGVVGVLATAGTFRSERYAQLMERYAGNIRVLQNPCTGLVEKIEAGLTEDPDTMSFLNGILQPMFSAGADTFVLGCTHYPLVRKALEQLVPADSVIIDPAPAVARQLYHRLQARQLLAPSDHPPQYRFHASGPEASLHRALTYYWPTEFSIV